VKCCMQPLQVSLLSEMLHATVAGVTVFGAVQ